MKAQKAYLKMLEQLRREWASLERQASPLEAANAKLNKVFDVGALALGHGVITLGDFTRVMRETAAETDKARHPFEEWIRNIDEDTAATKMNAQAREHAIDMKKAEDELHKAGIVVIDASTHAIIEQKIRQNELAHEIERTKGQTVAWLGELDKLHQKSDFGKGIETGLNSVYNEMQNVAEVASKQLTDAFHGVEDAIVSAATTGKVQWSSLLKMLEQDAARTVLRMGESGIADLFRSKPAANEWDAAGAASMGFLGIGRGQGGAVAPAAAMEAAGVTAGSTIAAAMTAAGADVAAMIASAMAAGGGAGSFGSAAGAAGAAGAAAGAASSADDFVSIVDDVERRAPTRVSIKPDVIVAALATDTGQEAVTNIVYKQHGATMATRARLRARS